MSDEAKPVTVLELAKFRGAKDDDGSISGGEFARVGLPIMGGCEVCEATIAAYNACPSKTGYLRCANGCIADLGWYDVAECNRDLFEDDTISDKLAREQVQGG